MTSKFKKFSNISQIVMVGYSSTKSGEEDVAEEVPDAARMSGWGEPVGGMPRFGNNLQQDIQHNFSNNRKYIKQV